MRKNLAIGVGAWSLAGALLAAAAHGQPSPEIGLVAGAGGAGSGVAGMGFSNPAGVGGGIAPPFGELRVVNVGAGIPVGGALLLMGGGTTMTPIVEVVALEAPNTTLGGTIRSLEGSDYWIWVPSDPLVEGKTYQVRLSATDLGSFGVIDTFEVVPAIALDPPELVSEPSASAVIETSSNVCCLQYFGAGVLEDSSCFPSQQRCSIMLNPGLSTPNGAVLLGQFLFRIAPQGDTTGTTPLVQWPTAQPVMFYEQAETYCFDIEAIELVSGTVHRYPELARCAKHGQLPEVGSFEIMPGPALLDREHCHAPPSIYERQWCELNEEPCADDEAEEGCELYGYVCQGEPLPEDPMVGAGGFAGSHDDFGAGSSVAGIGGVGARAGASGLGGRVGSAGSSENSASDGCAISSAAPRGGDRGLLAWCAGFIAALVAARRGRAPHSSFRRRPRGVHGGVA